MAAPTPRLAEPGVGQSTTPVCARARSVARALVRLSRARVEVVATTTPWSSSTRRAISSRTGFERSACQPLGVVDEDGEVGMGPTVCDEALPVRVAVPGDAGDRVAHCAQRGRDGVQRRAPPRPRRPDDEDPPVATGDVEADALEVAVPDPDGQETADAVELTRSEGDGGRQAANRPRPSGSSRRFSVWRRLRLRGPPGPASRHVGERMRRVPITESCDLDRPVRPGVQRASWRLVGGHHPSAGSRRPPGRPGRPAREPTAGRTTGRADRRGPPALR